MIYSLDDIKNINIQFNDGCKIFLYGDLGAGKTTIVKNLLRNNLKIGDNIISPTYIHYKKYGGNIFHFDLYRLDNYDDFINIGGEEIMDNKENICFVEWPEIIEGFFSPDIKIIINKIEDNDLVRKIEIIDYR